MSQNNQFNFLLEKLLNKVGQHNDLEHFPTPESHYKKYCDITEQLRANVYPKINAGLASLSNRSGLYTDHSDSHFDLVVHYAGLMLGLNTSNIDDIAKEVISDKWILTPYEIYILLLSIRFHDVGNIYGREDHERMISKVINEFSITHLITNPIEAKKISQIGGAHGGKTPSGSKDTIGNLAESENFDGHIKDVKHKKIAAITRFADEICENRQRTGNIVESTIPVHNMVYHKYAESIVGNYIEGKTLCIRLQVKHSNLTQKYSIYTKNEAGIEVLTEALLPQVTLDRLRKTELERRYCNRYLPELAQVNEISVKIDILEDAKCPESFHHEVIDEKSFILKERDYPSAGDNILGNPVKDFLDYDRICKLQNIIKED
ncbi:MAG: hypothetical protein ACJAXJ_004403 [Colwellia sp.]|jgi:hypothetical protein